MSDEEVLTWIRTEYKRANTLPKKEANDIKYRAHIIYNKRFPNPPFCPTCYQVLPE